MTLSPKDVAAASAAWVYVPDEATRIETDEYLLVRSPAWFDADLDLVGLDPRGDLDHTVARVLRVARETGAPELTWWIKLGTDAGIESRVARLGELDETVDVLALDLARGVPDLGRVDDVEVRWIDDAAGVVDAYAVLTEVFGGSLPPDGQVDLEAAKARVDLAAGEIAIGVVDLDGRPVGTGGVTIADGVARLWNGSVREEARGRGAYRALLRARLGWAVAQGATMALVKGRVETSGPVLRRAGFEVFGQERSYRVPLDEGEALADGVARDRGD